MKNYKKVLMFVLILIAFVFVCPQSTVNICAEDVEKNYVVDSEDVNDRLYGVLCDIKGTKTLYQKDFIEETSLDLTSINNLSSLDGLDLFRFDALESINIEGNRLTNITKENLSSMPNLLNLNLAGNKLENIDLSGLSKLEVVDLKSNNLKSINLSSITSEVRVDISNNNFVTFNNVTLPSKSPHATINIIGNNITDIPSEYLLSDKITIQGGVQGVKSDEIITLSKKTNLCYYNTNIDGLELKIYNGNGDLIKTLTDGENGKVDVGLDVGKYYYRYYLNGELAYDDEDLNDRNSYIKKVYKGYDFIILPNSPTYNFEHNGKVYESIRKVTGAVTINLIKDSENDVVYYKFNGGEWQQGDKVVCDQGGNYNVVVKSVCVIDGKEYESEPVDIFIKTSLNTVIPDGLMLVIVLAITLTLFFVVVPIVSKKFFNKKK